MTQAKEEIKEEKIDGRERESNMGIGEERRMESNKIKVGLHYDKFQVRTHEAFNPG